MSIKYWCVLQPWGHNFTYTSMQHKLTQQPEVRALPPPGHCCSCTPAKVMVHIRKPVWLKTNCPQKWEKTPQNSKPNQQPPRQFAMILRHSCPARREQQALGRKPAGRSRSASSQHCQLRACIKPCSKSTCNQRTPYSTKEQTLSGRGCWVASFGQQSKNVFL